jgi:hypothetical protein
MKNGPIQLPKLSPLILAGESLLNCELKKFWECIKITPIKWRHQASGDDFWIVALSGDKVIWYNDIEDGFNICNFEKYGIIPEMKFEQNALNIAILRLYTLDF